LFGRYASTILVKQCNSWT